MLTVDRNAGAQGRLEIAADGVGVPPELSFPQHEYRDRHDDSGHDDRIRQDRIHAPQQIAGHLGPVKEVQAATFTSDVVDQRVVAVATDAGRQTDDGSVLGQEQGDASNDEGAPQCHDEGRHLELGDDHTVEETDESRSADGGREPEHGGKKQWHSAVVGRPDRQGREHGCKAHHPADRQVDAGADDHERLTEAQQQNRGDRDQDVLRVAQRQKVDRTVADQRHRDHEEHDHHHQKHPGPHPAEREDEALERSGRAGGGKAHSNHGLGLMISHYASSS